MSGRKLIVMLVVFLSATWCFASSQNATVSGGVYDTSGKPIPGIRVVLDNPALGFERDATTGDDGAYTITEVPPQDGYRITAYRGATKLDARAGLTVTVGEEKNILPPLHEVPAVATGGNEVKEQRLSAVSTETLSTSISGVISGDQLRSLPLFNRNFLALGLLTPNTHDTEGGSVLAGATFGIAGSRPNTNMFLLDGSDNTARSSNQAIPFQVNDSVQEFRVISSNANAEYGGSGGGVVNVVTRRASNDFHGNVFGYFNNDALNANQPLSVYNGTTFDRAASYAGGVNAAAVTNFSPANYNQYVATAEALGFCTDSIGATHVAGTHPCVTGGFGKDTRFNPNSILKTNDSTYQPYNSRQFGANVGGPLRKDKLFVFASYEGTQIDNPNQIFERVPSTFDRTYNPLLAAGVPNAAPYVFGSNDPNFVMAQKILALYPKSNVVAVPGVLEFFKGQAPNYTNVHNGLLRSDFAQSKNTNWSFRYSLQDLNQLHDDSLPASANYAGNGAFRQAFNQNITLTNSHTFHSGMINEGRLGFTRFRIDEAPQDGNLDATKLGFPGKQMMTVNLAGLDPQYSGASPNNPGAFGSWEDTYWEGPNPSPNAATYAQNMFPTLAGLFPMARLGAPLSAPGQRRDSTWILEDSISVVHGRHNLKFGAGYRRFDNRISNDGLSRGLVSTSSIGAFTSDSMSSITNGEAFFAPTFDYAIRQPAGYLGRFYSFAMDGFAQDSWRVSSRVVLNLGLRYDYFSTPTEASNNIWNFDPAANGLVQAGTHVVVDPYGRGCAGGKAQSYDALYEDAGGLFPFGWKCNTQGTGSLPGANRWNVGPRLGGAWDLTGSGKNVLRAGAGWFFDQQPINNVAQLMFNRPTPLNLTNPQAIYGQIFSNDLCGQCGLGITTVNQASLGAFQPLFAPFQAASSPLPVYAIDANHYNSPYTAQINFSYQHQFGSTFVGELGYIHTAGDRLAAVNNSGFDNEWFCSTSKPQAGTAASCDALNPVFTLANQAKSNYHSLFVRARVAQYKGLMMNLSYSYSRSFDNASNAVFSLPPITLQNQIFAFQYAGLGAPFRAGANAGKGASLAIGSDALAQGLTTTGAAQVFVSRYTVPQDPDNYLRDDYGRSDFDVAHRVVWDYAWDVPLFAHADARKANIFGHWRISGVFVGQSGQPYTVFSGPLGGELVQRADIFGAVTTNINNPNKYLDPGAFELASKSDDCGQYGAIGTGVTAFNGTNGQPCLGNTARNQFTGPMFVQMDMALQKGVQFGESRQLNFRAEMFNLFNNANYYNPISALSLDGGSRNPDFGRIMSAHSPFQVQLAARFSW